MLTTRAPLRSWTSKILSIAVIVFALTSHEILSRSANVLNWDFPVPRPLSDPLSSSRLAGSPCHILETHFPS